MIPDCNLFMMCEALNEAALTAVLQLLRLLALTGRRRDD